MTFPVGYSTEPGLDPAEDNIGPFYYRQMGDLCLYGFVAEDKHCNVAGIVHGGVLMTFADFSLCMEATEHYKKEDCVTVSFSCDFVAAGQHGNFIECKTRVTRKTGSLVFITGEIFSGDEAILTCSAVIKRLPRDS